MRLLPLSLFMLLVLLFPTQAQNKPVLPNFWDPQERFVKPNVKDMPRLRFLTTTDFPPFSFVDSAKRLSGFHVDLARAICEELDVSSVCQIQALPFAEISRAVTGGAGEAAIAGIVISEKSRETLAFSRPYFRLPARFVAKTKDEASEPLLKSLSGKPVGIVDGTAHAAYAQAYFGDMDLQLFETRDAALAALKKDRVKAVFTDALNASFWLQTEEMRANQSRTRPCCRFIGGAYLSETYFGNGLAIAVPKNNQELVDAINFALRSINDKGRFAELYLRYFPISLY